MHSFRTLVLTLLLSAFASTTIVAQNTDDYMTGIQLIRQSQFEQAYEIFNRLYQKNPNNFPVFDQLINTLINLKRYDEAITITQRKLNQNYADIVLATKLGELYHLNGEIETAFSTWNRALEANQNSLQAYRYIGDNMIYRREHEKATELFLKARRNFNNPTLFFAEITNSYVALGKREDAVKTLVDVLGASPGNGAYVLRQIISYDDSQITELAIIDINERLSARLIASPEVTAYYEVLIGLLMEARYYRRALATAKRFESQSENGVWPVYSLASRLKSQLEFDLAEEALSYYINQPQHQLYTRSLEDRALLYITWSKYLKDYNLDFGTNVNQLNDKALQDLDQLITNHSNYERIIEVLSLKTELILDTINNVELANSLVQEIRSNSVDENHQIIAEYLEGRVHMTRGSHSMARLNLTRANRLARIGEMAEKTRYYLALNDFYAGDFEFSSIQMRALENLSTSYYANDALKLRVWMREGIQQDVPSEDLKHFAKAKFLLDNQNNLTSLSLILPIISGPDGTPLKAESTLLVVEHLKSSHPFLVYDLLTKILSTYNGSLAERLTWEKVRIADGIMSYNVTHQPSENETIDTLKNWIDSQNSGDTLNSPSLTIQENNQHAVFDINGVITMYEDMITRFPSGFYANTVRNRIAELNLKAL